MMERIGTDPQLDHHSYDLPLKDEPLKLHHETSLFNSCARVWNDERCNLREPGCISEYKQVAICRMETSLALQLSEHGDLYLDSSDLIKRLELFRRNMMIRLEYQDARKGQWYLSAWKGKIAPETHTLFCRYNLSVPLIVVPRRSVRIIATYKGDLGKINSPHALATWQFSLKGIEGREAIR